MKNFFRPVRPIEADTKILRDKLERDMEEFLAQGGVIQVIPNGVRTTPMIETRRKLNHAQIRTLIAKKTGVDAEEEEE